jgi:hypothetical protein
MSPMIDDTDILEYPSPASQGDECHESSRRERSPVLAWFGRLFTPVPRLQPRRQEHCVPGASRFETPLDILAREYPDIHLRVMSGMG